VKAEENVQERWEVYFLKLELLNIDATQPWAKCEIKEKCNMPLDEGDHSHRKTRSLESQGVGIYHNITSQICMYVARQSPEL
jgi:hypothetical protein